MDKIKEIEVKIQKVDKEMELNVQESDSVFLRRRDAKDKLENFKDRLDSLRAERRNLAGEGADLSKINEQIGKFVGEREVIEDTIEGTLKRLEALESRRVKLKNGRFLLQKKIIVQKVRPLIAKYNVIAEQLSPVLSELWKLLGELGDPALIEEAVRPSSWHGAVHHVPRLYLSEDFDPATAKDFFRK